MTRVAYVCTDPGVPVYGRKGASIHVQEVVRALRRRGCDVELFTTRVGGAPPPDLADVAVHRLTPVGKGDPAARERRALAANAEVEAALSRAGDHAPFAFVYERYALWSRAGMYYAHDRGLPGIVEVNAPLPDEQARHRTLVDRPAAERVAREVFTAASAVVAVSPPVADWVRRRTPHPERVHVVANGVDPGRFPRTARPSDPRRCTVGFVGTLKPWHGLGTLVDAFALLAADEPGWRLLLVGDGPLRSQLAALLARRGLAGRSHLPGAVDPAAVPALLDRMDLATAPYPREGGVYFSPLKIYEYLAAGLPIVASRTPAVTRVLIDGVTAALVEPDDSEALAAALAGLRREPARAAALGASARVAARTHTWDAVAARILRLAGCAVPEAA